MKDISFKVGKSDKKSLARVGVITTPHGVIHTPSFTPVGTQASVKTLSPEDLINCKSQVVLANTYHLSLRPGVKVIEKFGGFGPFMGWTGPTITDSGGYQVSFIRGSTAKVTDQGAVFTSYLDGSKHLITPEKSMEIQKSLGADIIMAFDQPLGKDFSELRRREAFRRTLLWEERSLVHWKKLKSKQALYGIVQGELDYELRKKSLDFVISMGFPGIAIGGESVGATPKVTREALSTISEFFPKDLPVHALGLGGGPEGIFAAVENGIDTFDNTGITRMARTGLLFISPEDGGTSQRKFRVNIKSSKFKSVKKPLSRVCECYTCTNFSAGYLHHLLISGEILGLRLATIHNVFFINDLMEKIRSSIAGGEFSSLKKHWS